MLLPCTLEVPVAICVGSPTLVTGFISVGFEILSGGGYDKFFHLNCNAVYATES